MRVIIFLLTVMLSVNSAHATCGIASKYGNEKGQSRTATGERYNPSRLTAASRSLPFGKEIRVVNQENGLSVTVRINDRGPFVRGRILDLSLGAARAIGMGGLARVCF